MIPGRISGADSLRQSLLTEDDGWPAEASERIIAALHALCVECDGQGEVPTGRRIPADIFGPAEPITRRCGACNGSGRRQIGETK